MEPSIGRGGFGGFVDVDNVLWSTGNFLRWDTDTSVASVSPSEWDLQPDGWWAVAHDSQRNIWVTRDWHPYVYKYSPQGDLLGQFTHGSKWAQGIVIDHNDHVWIAHSHCGADVGHLLPDGTFVGNVPVVRHGPTAVDVDRKGRIWVSGTGGIIQRINPLGGPIGADGKTPVGAVDLSTSYIGGTPWTYSDFTGGGMGDHGLQGCWEVVFDGRFEGAHWGAVKWNGEICDDGIIAVSAATSKDGVHFGPFETLQYSNDGPKSIGRFIKVRVILDPRTSALSPVLHNITVGTVDYDEPEQIEDWSVITVERIDALWPDPIALKGGFCRTAGLVGLEPEISWSVVSGPGIVTFVDVSNPGTVANFSQEGEYVLRLTGQLNGDTRIADLHVFLTPHNKSPWVTAGETRFVTEGTYTVSLEGEVRDDGMPEGIPVTTNWAKLFGPGEVIFADPHDPKTEVTFSEEGIYILQLSATDTEYEFSNSVEIRVGAVCSSEAPSGLVSWWQVNGDGADHISGNQLFLEGGANFSEGKVSAALDFDGKGGTAHVFASPTLDLKGASGLSVEFWARPDTYTGTGVVVGWNDGTGGVEVEQRYEGSGAQNFYLHLTDTEGGAHSVSFHDGFNWLNVWQHFAVSYDRASGVARIYRNGVLQEEKNAGNFAPKTSGDLYFGSRKGTEAFFEGGLDEVSIYNRALDASEIWSIYSADWKGKCPPDENQAPGVDAGPNLYVSTAGGSVTLSGVVNDDGLPVGAGLRSRWKVLAGPGTVTIADAGAAVTTASFDTEGLYLLALEAEDGASLSRDQIEVRVGALCQAEVREGLVGWWPCNGLPVDLINGNDALLSSGARYTDARVSQGFEFAGSRGTARVPGTSVLDVGTGEGLSIEFWARPDTYSGTGVVVGWNDGTGGVEVEQRYEGSGAQNFYLHLTDTEGGAHAVSYYDGFNWLNVWQHFAVTYDRASGVARIYRNGVLQVEKNVESFTPETGGDLYFGSRKGTEAFFEGGLDEVSIYNRALDASEIWSIYSADWKGKCPPDENQAPGVDAGPNLYVSTAGGSVTLSGVVNDDGLPVGAGLRSRWKVLAGPGTVTIDDEDALVTTARFDTEGLYLLALEAEDGASLNRDQIEVRVGALCQAEVREGLVGWWPGNGLPVDLINGNDALLSSGARYTDARVSQGFEFAGSRGTARVPGASVLDVGTGEGLSIEFWARPDTYSGTGVVVGWNDGTGGVEVEQRYEGSGAQNFYLHLTDTEGGAHAVSYYDGFNWLNVWQHFAVTYDRASGVARIYRNGVLQVEKNVGSFTPETGEDLYFGSRKGTEAFFEGGLDEVSIYNRALDGSEIWAIYSSDWKGKCPPDNNQAPEVDAGSDLYVNVAGGTVTLSGVVNDDGLPVGPGLRSSWKVLAGPGTATIDDEDALVTTARFDTEGLYLLALEAEDGASLNRDQIEVRVGALCRAEVHEGLVGWWPGNGLPVDLINGNDALLSSGARYTDARVSQGFEFAGSRGTARVPGTSVLDVGTGEGLSIEFWARPDTYSGTGVVVGWNDGTGGVEVEQRYEGSGAQNFYLHLTDTEGGAHAVSYYDGFNWLNVWQHFAVTYDRASGVARIYRNGVLQVEKNVGSFTPETGGDLFFGSRKGTGEFFDGGLDEVSVYNRALDGSELWAIYSSDWMGKCPPDDNNAPEVDAGPDLYANMTGGTVTLSGVVNDDGLPVGSGLRSKWKVLAGPGTVAIDAEDALVTTASFDTEGLYLLALEAEDGASLSRDQIEVRVGALCRAEVHEGLVGWWPGNGLPVDLINGNDALLSSGAGYVDAHVSQGFEFDGSRATARVPGKSILDVGMGEGLTVEFWARPDSYTGTGVLVGWNDGTAGVEVEQRYVSSGVQSFYLNLTDSEGGAHPVGYYDGFNELNVWQHFAVTYDKSSGVVRIYRNGVLQVEKNVGRFTPKTIGDLYFGSRKATEVFFDGGLDEVSIYSRALGSSEIQEIFDSGSCGKSQINKGPLVDAGPDAGVALPNTLTLSGNVEDDGLPYDIGLTAAWSVVEGPGAVTFDPVDEAITTVSFEESGDYVLRLEATDGSATSEDTVAVVVRPMPIAPTVAIANPTDGETLPAPASLKIEALARDEDGAVVRVDFFENGELIASDTTVPFTHSISGKLAGTYRFKAVASDDTGLTGSSEEIVFTVGAAAPVVSIDSPTDGQKVSLGRNVEVSATATDADGSIVRVDFFDREARIGTSTAPPHSITLTNLAAGVHSLTAIATDNDELSAASASVTIEVVDLGGNERPILEILSPIDGDVVTEPTDIVGMAAGNSLDSYWLEYRHLGSDCAEWITFSGGSSPVFKDSLGTLDPTLLVNGNYQIRLVARDINGGLSAVQRTIAVDGGMKVGHFTLALNDLTIPLAGIPITINRIYDSRDPCSGDFGYGWNLDLDTIRLELSRTMGEGWNYFVHEGSETDPSFYRIDDEGPHLAMVRMPGDETLRFRPKAVLKRSPNATGSIVDADGDVIGLAFAPISYSMPLGIVYRVTGGSRGATLSVKGYKARDPWFGSTVTVGPDAPFYVQYPLVGPMGLATHENSAQDAPLVEDATGWFLTMQDGRSFEFDVEGDLVAMSDGLGNKLTINRDGSGRIRSVTHSSGESINFNRDSEGRITSITDPRGNQLHYVYASNGDLDCSWERTTPFPGPPTVRYYYKGETHLLDRIVDAGGKQAVRNEYDNDGRLLKTIDADSNETIFTHDIAGRTENIRNRDGHTTFHRYDERGNVVETVTPDGTRTVTAYQTWSDGSKSDLKTSESVTGLFSDGSGRLITKTLTTSYVYEDDDPLTPPAEDGLLRKIVDPLGHATRFSYDDRGNVLAITDPTGRKTVNTYYPGSALLHTAIDAAGNVTTFTYDANGNADTETRTVTVVDAAGVSFTETLVTDYDYDGPGRLVRMTNPAGHVTAYEYDANGNRTFVRTTRTDADGNVHEVVTEHEYDANDRLVKTWDAEHSRSENPTATSEVVYNGIGKVWKTYDALRRVAERLYNDRGELWKTIYPDGTVEEIRYDVSGRREFNIDRRGYATQFLYDSGGRLTETRFHGVDGIVTLSSNQYDASGRVWKSIDPRGNTTTYIYDDAGRRVAIVDALGQRVDYEYDDSGNLRFFTDAKGQTTEHRYDALNRRVQTIYPVSKVWTGYGYQTIATQTQSAYDGLGRQLSETDQSGRTTRYVYDALGRLSAVVKPAPEAGGQPVITRYTYDELGNKLTQTDAKGRTTDYSYDNLGRRVTRVLPLGQKETIEYDAVGNIRYRTDFNGRTTEYQYDTMNRPRFRIPDSSFGETPVELTYTASGQRSMMSDGSGTTLYFYDARDRLEAVQRPEGTLSYAYDEAGDLRLIVSSTPEGAAMGYTYDALNRLDTVTDANNELTDYGYDANGNLRTVALPSGATATYSHNSVNQLVSLYHTENLLNVASYTYGLYPTGHRREVQEGAIPSAQTRNVHYEYDALWRLKTETITGDPDWKNGVVNYALDAVGNRNSRASSIPGLTSQSFSYDANDHVNGDTHDANGNTLTGMVSQPPDSGTSGTDAYDSQNRLIRRVGLIDGRSSTIAITYNGDGHKVREAVTSGGVTTTTTCLVDELNPTGYAQVVEEHTNGTLTRVYTYGHDLISMDQSDGNGAGWSLTYYGYDGHGNVRFLTDEQGQITDTYTYDAFGELLSSAGTTANPYRYCGEQFDVALGLYYLRARMMNPLTGRFWTMDSYEGQRSEPESLHKYLYASADGVNGTDPGGYMTLASVSAGAAIASGIRLEGLAVTLQQGSVAYAKASALQIQGNLRSAALDAILGDDWETADGLLSWSYLVSASLSASDGFDDIVQTAVGGAALYTLIRALPAAIRAAPEITQWIRNLPKLLSRVETPRNIPLTPLPYAGVREASAYLKSQSIPRSFRKQILQSFEINTLRQRQAGPSEYGLRYFDGVNAFAEGRYLFETFPASRSSLALKPEWNQMTFLKQFQIRPGTPLLEGRAASMGLGVGGGQVQKYILDTSNLLSHEY